MTNNFHFVKFNNLEIYSFLFNLRSVHVPSEDSEDVIGNQEESRVAVEPKATPNTKLEVTRDVKYISVTTKYKPRESGKELSVGKDNVGELLLLAIMVVPGPQPCNRLIDVMEVYTLDGHGVFVEAAMYIILRLKEDFGVI